MLSLSFFACQQVAKKNDKAIGDGVHHWNTQIKFYHQIKKKQQNGIAKVYITEPDKLRVDMMDPFGFVKVGTVIVNGGEAKFNFIGQKPYEGPVYDGMLKSLLKIDVSVRDFFSLFTQNNFSKHKWSCDENSSGLPLECVDQSENILVKWSDSMKIPGTECKVIHPKASIDIRVKSYKYYEEPRASIFAL